MADSRKETSPAARPEAVGESGEPFGSRWSRLKREARENAVEKPRTAPGAADAAAPPPDLPPTDALTFDSDYRQFLHPKVEEGVRRAALKKLFSDPRFNVMDGLDVYIDDYSKTEPIPAAMLAGLKQAQNILQWAKEDAEERQKEAADAEKAIPEDPGHASFESAEMQSASGGGLDAKTAEPAPVSVSDSSRKTQS